MRESATPILASGSCWTAPLPFKEPGADLSACGHPQLAYEDSTHQNPLSYAGIRGSPLMAPSPSFLDVTTCLRNQSPEEVPKAPPIPVAMGMMAAPGMVTMSTSHVVQNEATGATYLDTVTTSIGRVALSVPEGRITMPGPQIEDVMDLI